jgi:outer membrane lipoprotein-sorting protein
VFAALASACSAPLMKLPSGAGTTASDIAWALAQATGTCRTIRTLTAEVAVSGSAGGHRLRGRLSVGVAAPASARLEAVAPFGPPVFIFVATGDEATLLLPRDARVLEHGRPDAVLDAVAGVPLGAGDLRATLTGCAAEIAQPQGVQLGDHWRRVRDANEGELYLHRAGGAQPWQLVTGVRRSLARAWREEYRDHQRGLPRSIRMVSIDSEGRGGDAFDLRLTLSQVETNVTLDADVFRVQIPGSAAPITLEELRDARTGFRKN